MNKYLKEYIIDCIDCDGYGTRFVYDMRINERAAIRERIDFLAKKFLSEYYMQHRGTKVSQLADYFRGLPSCFNMEFRDYEIGLIGVKWGYVPEKMSKDDFVDKWWDILANGVRELAIEFPTERSVRAFV